MLALFSRSFEDISLSFNQEMEKLMSEKLQYKEKYEMLYMNYATIKKEN
jgi:hypothetical protein